MYIRIKPEIVEENENERLENQMYIDQLDALSRDGQNLHRGSINPLNEYNRDALEYTLPWPIIQRIFKLASRALCTCVNSDAFKKTHQDRSSIMPNDRYDDPPRHLLELHGKFVVQQRVKQHSLTGDQLCSIHRFSSTVTGRKPQFVYTAQETSSYNHKYKGVEQENCRWMRSMALLCKRMFSFIATQLFTTVVINSTKNTWYHVTNNYCIIKKPKTLIIVPSKPSQPSLFFMNRTQTSLAKEFFEHVEHLHICEPFLLQNTASISYLVSLMPNIRSFTLNCDIDRSVLIDLFNGPLQTIPSLNLINARVVMPRTFGLGQMQVEQEGLVIGSLIQPTFNLTKIILLQPFDWNSLGKEVKQNLQVISLLYPHGDKIKLVSADFPNLRHVYTMSHDRNHDHLPNSVAKVTYLDFQLPILDIDFLHTNISTIQFKTIHSTKSDQYTRLSIKNVNTIIILSSFDVCQSDINHFNDLGYDHIGTSPYNRSNNLKSSQKKLFFIKKKYFNQNQNQNQNDQNNNNQNNNNYQNQKINNSLPTFIIYKIIGMTFKLRERCTCVYEKETVLKWIDKGDDILDEQEEMKRFNEMKNNCPTHFSHSIPYVPLSFSLQDSNRSKLQLALINKDIFNYISGNCFSTIQLEKCFASTSAHSANPYCVAFKHLTTLISCSNVLERIFFIKDNLLHITKLLANGDDLKDIIKHLPNLTTIYISQIPSRYNLRLDISNLGQLTYLSKLNFIGSNIEIDHLTLLNEIKNLPLQKLCLPSNSLGVYSQLFLGLKQSITKMSVAASNWQDLCQFPNVRHIVIVDDYPIHSPPLPNTITKVTSHSLDIDFLPKSQSVETLKIAASYRPRGCLFDISQLSPRFNNLVRKLSLECHHVENFIYGYEYPFNIPDDLFGSFNYRIEYSRTSLITEYIKLKRE
ncbi:hypothetical protein DFA_08211 [Cavenderia fasciculata]|uniref:Uncharacterized protein n=1 Tax=Cavenderia fasciculata TaxID=261658 RepID=F4Q5G3_CACFS|nr:uncharacterized protein DFA_08211 [Cavenderia fasciculata]EGG17222.1 hypothetical protein DFA_08211 [Cavenderia fasciculata]|eukprot:XP_004355706.1 hypothetical protein DFA_08211 [Cavenderia fasciculata]